MTAAVTPPGCCGYSTVPRQGSQQELACSSTMCYARAAEGGAGEEEIRGDEGTGNRAKEVARIASGKAAGARVIGG
jgi:hypothetical protein